MCLLKAAKLPDQYIITPAVSEFKKRASRITAEKEIPIGLLEESMGIDFTALCAFRRCVHEMDYSRFSEILTAAGQDKKSVEVAFSDFVKDPLEHVTRKTWGPVLFKELMKSFEDFEQEERGYKEST